MSENSEFLGKTFEERQEERRLRDEAMEKAHSNIEEKIGRPDLEEASVRISRLMTHKIAYRLDGIPNPEEEVELDKLVEDKGTELATYFVEKRQRLEDKYLAPTKDDSFTTRILWEKGYLKGNDWENWDYRAEGNIQ